MIDWYSKEADAGELHVEQLKLDSLHVSKDRIAYRNILTLEFAKFQITPKYPLFLAVCGSNKEKKRNYS